MKFVQKQRFCIFLWPLSYFFMIFFMRSPFSYALLFFSLRAPFSHTLSLFLGVVSRNLLHFGTKRDRTVPPWSALWPHSGRATKFMRSAQGDTFHFKQRKLKFLRHRKWRRNKFSDDVARLWMFSGFPLSSACRVASFGSALFGPSIRNCRRAAPNVPSDVCVVCVFHKRAPFALEKNFCLSRVCTVVWFRTATSLALLGIAPDPCTLARDPRATSLKPCFLNVALSSLYCCLSLRHRTLIIFFWRHRCTFLSLRLRCDCTLTLVWRRRRCTLFCFMMSLHSDTQGKLLFCTLVFFGRVFAALSSKNRATSLHSNIHSANCRCTLIVFPFMRSLIVAWQKSVVARLKHWQSVAALSKSKRFLRKRCRAMTKFSLHFHKFLRHITALSQFFQIIASLSMKFPKRWEHSDLRRGFHRRTLTFFVSLECRGDIARFGDNCFSSAPKNRGDKWDKTEWPSATFSRTIFLPGECSLQSASHNVFGAWIEVRFIWGEDGKEGPFQGHSEGALMTLLS